MDLPTVWVPVLLIVAAVPAAGLGYLAWQHRRAPGALPLALSAVLVAAWCGLAAIESTTNTPAPKLLLLNLIAICQSVLPVLWLLVVLEFTGSRPWLRRAQVWLFVIPIVTLALATVNGRPAPAGAGVLVSASPWFAVQQIYSGLLLAISFLLLARAWPRAAAPQRGPLSMLLACLLLPLAWGLMSAARPSEAAEVTLALSTLFLVAGLYSLRLFDLTPLAQAALVSTLPEAMVVIDLDGRLVDFNPAAARLFDWPASDARASRGRPAGQALAGWPHLAELLAVAPGTAAPAELVSGLGADRRVYELSLTPLANAHGRALGRLLTLRDATAYHRIEDELARLATTDELTGLADRQRGYEALTDEIRRARRYESALSVLLIDLDQFKPLNDQIGRQAGDEMLRAVARAIQRLARQSDLPARAGSDEFMLILPHTNLLGAETVAGRLLAAVSQISAGSQIPAGAEPARLRLSLGAAELTADDDDPGESLLARAEKAMRAAKAAGGGRVVVEDRASV